MRGFKENLNEEVLLGPDRYHFRQLRRGNGPKDHAVDQHHDFEKDHDGDQPKPTSSLKAPRPPLIHPRTLRLNRYAIRESVEIAFKEALILR